MTFSLHTQLPPPPRAPLPAPLRALAWMLRRLSVAMAVVAVWQRVWLRRIWGVRWKLEGSCKSCGNCCEHLLMPVGKPIPGQSLIRRFWHEYVFDFYPKDLVLEADGRQFRAYGCRNFKADRTCARYSLRPFVCRIYPALPLYTRPKPKPHCGFTVIDD